MLQSMRRGQSVAWLGSQLRQGVETCENLTIRCLDVIDVLNPELNAFVTLAREQAVQEARERDVELASGRDRGPLHGIPIAVKDMIDTASLLTTMGSSHFAGNVPAQDAACVAAARRAGAVVIGKTTTHEFAYGPTGDRSAQGPSRNPIDPTRMSGGSSGGSAVAVAAGMAPLALGTDTGGSARIPAAFCGVVGFKPSHARLSMEGVFPLAPSLDDVGLLAATVQDCRLLWMALAGPTPHRSVGPDRVPAAVHIGWLDPALLCATDPRIRDRALAMLTEGRERPHRVEHAVAPELIELLEAYTHIQSSEAYALHADLVATAPGLYDDEVLARLKAASQTAGWEYVRAIQTRDRVHTVVAQLFTRFQVLAMPTLPVTAPVLGSRALQVDGTTVSTRDALLALTSIWNVLGLPALSMPAGLVDGLPVGLQLIAATGQEDLLLSIAREIEENQTSK